jgi:hypothetical protein
MTAWQTQAKNTCEECAGSAPRYRRRPKSFPTANPLFFAGGKVYAMFANNHHSDGHVAIWIPVPPGLQAALIKTEPKKFFMLPYVGVRGWVGIELEEVSDEDLAFHICEAWNLIAPKKLRTF